MRAYGLTSPSERDGGDGCPSTAYPPDTSHTTSLIGKNHNNNNNSNNNNNNSNGLFNGSISLTSAMNGERARLFKKANSYGKPVREWYV